MEFVRGLSPRATKKGTPLSGSIELWYSGPQQTNVFRPFYWGMEGVLQEDYVAWALKTSKTAWLATDLAHRI